MQIATIKMKTTKLVTEQNKQNIDYLGNDQKWWFNEDFKHSFCIFDLNAHYEDEYFKTDHVSVVTVENFARLFPSIISSLIKSNGPFSILEIGCAGGWFTEALMQGGHEVLAVEGAKSGYQSALRRGIPSENLILHDIRTRLDLKKRFNVVICTEVAEHIEAPLAGVLVDNLTRHSDIIWFSFEEPNTNEAAYYHVNEMPLKYWRHLFAFYGYRMIAIPDEVRRSIDNRGNYLCVPFDFHQDAFPEQAYDIEDMGLSEGAEKDRLKRMHRRLNKIKRLLPPLIFDQISPFFEKLFLPRCKKNGLPYFYTPPRYR